ncbi:MAG: WD40 repeat domain-containing protein, partial [Candidatus Electrothrix sp. ATG2]|nr:WD40 repeat domain-containing protein [Candidatus Electrothrix sp. ATG2]
KTEEANQLLRYYLAQQSGVIPLRRLRFIRAHVDKPLLRQPNARRLFRKSLIRPALASGMMLFVAVLMAGGLYLTTTAQVQWQSKVIGRHWGEGETGFVRSYTLPESEQVISGLRPESDIPGIMGTQYDDAKTGMTFINKTWNVKTGMVVGSNKILDKNTAVNKWSLSRKEDYIVICGAYSDKRKKCELIKFDDLSITDLPYLDFVYSANLTKSEDYINYTTYNGSNHYTAVLWSVKGENIARQVKNIKNPDDKWNISFKFSADGNKLVALSQEDDRDVLILYDTITGKKIKNLTDEDKKGVKVELHSLTRKICTVSEELSGGKTIQLWNINDGSFVKGTTISSYDVHDPVKVHFTDDGQYILVNYDYVNFNIVTAHNLKPAYGVKFGEMHLGNDKDKHSAPIVYWRDRKDVKLWHVSKEEPILLKNIKLGDKDSISSSTDMQRAVIYGPLRPAELWDVKRKKRLCLLTSHENKYIQSVAFTMNDTAVIIEEEGGIASLFDAKDGSPLAQHISA